MDKFPDFPESSRLQKHPSLLQYKLVVAGLCWSRTCVLLKICPHTPTEPAAAPSLENCWVCSRKLGVTSQEREERDPENRQRQDPGEQDLLLRVLSERTDREAGYGRAGERFREERSPGSRASSMWNGSRERCY